MENLEEKDGSLITQEKSQAGESFGKRMERMEKLRALRRDSLGPNAIQIEDGNGSRKPVTESRDGPPVESGATTAGTLAKRRGRPPARDREAIAAEKKAKRDRRKLKQAINSLKALQKRARRISLEEKRNLEKLDAARNRVQELAIKRIELDRRIGWAILGIQVLTLETTPAAAKAFHKETTKEEENRSAQNGEVPECIEEVRQVSVSDGNEPGSTNDIINTDESGSVSDPKESPLIEDAVRELSHKEACQIDLAAADRSRIFVQEATQRDDSTQVDSANKANNDGAVASQTCQNNARREPGTEAFAAAPNKGGGRLAGKSNIVETADPGDSLAIKKKDLAPGIIGIPWSHPSGNRCPDPPQQVTAGPARHAPQMQTGPVFDAETHQILIPPTREIDTAVKGKNALTVVAIKGKFLRGITMGKLAKKMGIALKCNWYIHYDRRDNCISRRYANLVFLCDGQWTRGEIEKILKRREFDCFTFPNRNEIAPWASNNLFSALCHAGTHKSR